MNRFIAAALFVAAQWQPAHAQTILGSIPEEFRGDWCSQEKTSGEEIFRPSACKLKPGSLSIDRMTLDTGRLSCVFDSGTATDGTLKMRMHCTDPEEEQLVSRIRGVSSLQKIRLSSDGANPLNGSRNWRADGDGCVEFAPDAGVAHGLRV